MHYVLCVLYARYAVVVVVLVVVVDRLSDYKNSENIYHPRNSHNANFSPVRFFVFFCFSFILSPTCLKNMCREIP